MCFEDVDVVAEACNCSTSVRVKDVDLVADVVVAPCQILQHARIESDSPAWICSECCGRPEGCKSKNVEVLMSTIVMLCISCDVQDC